MGGGCMLLFVVHLEDNDNQPQQEQALESALSMASQVLAHHLRNTPTMDAHKTIAFVIPTSSSLSSSLHPGDSWWWDFDTFYDWYLEAEQAMLDDQATVVWDESSPADQSPPQQQQQDESFQDDNHHHHQEDEDDEMESLSNLVTWAPFHPHWRYSSSSDDHDQDDVLELEKQAPYPTITLVSSEVIYQTGLPQVTEQIAHDNARILSAKSRAEWHDIYQTAVYQQQQPPPPLSP